MKHLSNCVRTTLVGGIWFLVPVVVMVFIIEKALSIADKIVKPLAAAMPWHSIFGVGTPILLAVVLIVLFCFLTGLVARAGFARKLVNWLERTLLSNLPGYELLKTLLGNSVGNLCKRLLNGDGDEWL